ncbi:MAG: esterase family protein [Bacteroidales bacterium]|nr:esterase family protein [Bacteroidales bacterium]
MRKLLPLLLVAVLACSCSAARYARGPKTEEIPVRYGGKGILEAVNYPSGESDLDHRRMVVYLPEDYYRDSLRRYPVLYLFHGARGNEVTWIDSASVLHALDSLRGEGKARDFILVMPNMNNYFGQRDYKDGHAVNAVRAFWSVDGEVERHFVQDVVMRVDSLYRTVRAKSGRAVAGMSSGALQALYLSATYPDAFDYVGLFSPYAYNSVAAINHEDIYGALWRKLRRQFAVPPRSYSIYIGRTDFFYPHMVLFDKRLTRKGYPHRFVLAEGGHEWYNWSDFYTDFCQQLFQ